MTKAAKTIALLAVTAILAWSPLAAQMVQVDKEFQPYKATSGVSGSLNSIGSDTLNNVMTLWAEGFQRHYPNVKAQIEGKGSGTAPPALISGTAQLGPMSRLMKPSEIDDFEKKYGYKPTVLKVAVDALAVWVNKDTPLDTITMPQIDAVFSKTRKGGYEKDLSTWGDLGLKGEWAARPISLYGRNSASGTYGYFKEHALYKGDFKDTVKEQPGSAAVVQGVTADKFAMGYSGIGYKTSDVKALKVALTATDEAFGTDAANVYSGKYPLSRYLYVYVNKAPNRPLDPLVREFLKFVLSREGQEIVIKDGYLPITREIHEETLSVLK
jgi:phosphate transport system substrate-binding protein